MRVLIVDDEANIRKTTAFAVDAMGHEVECVATSAQAFRVLEERPCDVCFLDLKLGEEDGLEILNRLQKKLPELVVVMFTAYANIATAVEAMRRGAFDFIPKPFTPEQVRQVLTKVEKTRSLERRVQQLESRLSEVVPVVDMQSTDPITQKTFEVAIKVASSSASVLILGPSGTGKSVLARQIHERSPQQEHAFVTVNCPSLSRELLESELFGHVKGSFTGAVNDTFGKVAAAEGGTLFLDEIGELPLAIQPKLLRLLQEREYERLGEQKVRRANVRVIAATNRNLAEEVKAGHFREDLFYRLNVITLTLPGLRDRPGDLPQLAESSLRFFAERMGKKVTGFAPAVVAAFSTYSWPGNLRELRNIIERAVILCAGERIEPVDLPELFNHQPDSRITVGARVTIDELESEHIRRIIASAPTLEEAARILGIDPATLYRKRQKLGLM